MQSLNEIRSTSKTSGGFFCIASFAVHVSFATFSSFGGSRAKCFNTSIVVGVHTKATEGAGCNFSNVGTTVVSIGAVHGAYRSPTYDGGV